jgi:hypothetical protein
MVTSVPCQLCEKPVPLEIARINELGKPVHEECYLQVIRIAKPTESGEGPKPTTS